MPERKKIAYAGFLRGRQKGQSGEEKLGKEHIEKKGSGLTMEIT